MNLCLLHDREAHKLVSQGMVVALVHQIETCIDKYVIHDCVWSLTNICSSGLKVRNKILSQEPNIFIKMNSISAKFSQDKSLACEIAMFLHSALDHRCFIDQDQITLLLSAANLSGSLMKSFDFSDQKNYENSKLTSEANKFLIDVMSSISIIYQQQIHQVSFAKKID